VNITGKSLGDQGQDHHSSSLPHLRCSKMVAFLEQSDWILSLPSRRERVELMGHKRGTVLAEKGRRRTYD
jgi:hypothetical protein